MGPQVLEMSGLSYRFGAQIAVDQLSATVSTGEIVGLVGRNGAGKTTTMRLVMGILAPMGGAVSWHGQPIRPADRLRFGYMPEERGLYPQMRLLDQVSYFGRLHGLDAGDASRRAHGWLERLGLGGREADRLVALSHGNQQRVQLAVALVHNPELLVLDEPFAGLDPAAVDSLSELLREQANDGTAVLFSSHQLDLVEQLCDRIVILVDGRVLAAGTLAELRARLPRRLRVKVDAQPSWAAALPGVTVAEQDADGVLFVLEPGDDPQAILHAALAAGPLQHFGFEYSRLAELYRQLVPA
jgi:ABC-2 type transport system ATP-binding protein